MTCQLTPNFVFRKNTSKLTLTILNEASNQIFKCFFSQFQNCLHISNMNRIIIMSKSKQFNLRYIYRFCINFDILFKMRKKYIVLHQIISLFILNSIIISENRCQQIQKNNQNYLQLFQKIEYHADSYSTKRILSTSPNTITTDFIINGQFNDTTCSSSNCTQNLSSGTYLNSFMTAWIPQNEISVMQQSKWSTLLSSTTSYVLNIIGPNVSCIVQKILDVPTNSFYLSYSYQLYPATPVTNGGFSVYYNNNLLKTIQPMDYLITSESILINRTTSFQACQIKFCAAINILPTILYGTGITQVSFIQTYTDDKYYNTTTGLWQACSVSFNYCTNCQRFQTLICLACSDGYYLTTNASCVSCAITYGINCSTCNLTACLTCITGYYSISIGCIVCSSRDTQALTCNQSASLSCSNGIPQPNGICCSANRYYSLANTSCQGCTFKYANCTTCSNLICFTCISTFYLNPNGNTCASCISRFLYCNTCNFMICLSCLSTATYFNNVCCNVNQYYKNSTGSCSNCADYGPCNMCNSTQCIRCPGNYYQDINLRCIVCYNRFPGCYFCNSTICMTCLANYTLTSNKCCYSDSYYNSLTLGCSLCSSKYPDCVSCSQTACDSCNASFSLYATACCFSDSYYNSTSLICSTCISRYQSCLTCNQTNCLSCRANYIIWPFSCCLANEFQNSTTKSCQACQLAFQFCQTCNETQCLTCLSGINNFGQCCQSDEFYNTDNLMCQKCSSRYRNCNKCTPNSCINCLTGTMTYGHCCFLDEYYNAKQDQCLICTDNCVVCKVGICIKCEQDNILILNSCLLASKNPDVIAMKNQLSSIANTTFSNPIIQTINKNPTIKTILNAACNFFDSLDDLWLYSYHQREYSLTVSLILDNIRAIESGKYNPFNNIQLITNFTSHKINQFNNYTYFGKHKYMMVEQIGSGFYQNVINFVIVTIPQTFITFLVCRLFFYLFFTCKISKLFRQYSFNAFFVFTLLDGNMQFFTYICSNQFQTLFSSLYDQKKQNYIFVIIGFIFFEASIIAYLLFNYFYQVGALYFIDNSKNSLSGIFVLIVSSSIRNMSVSTVSSFSSENYQQQIWLLNLIQIIHILILFFFKIKFNCFRQKSIFWISLIFALLRFMLQLSFALLNKNVPGTDLQQSVQPTIFLIYLISWIITVIFMLTKLILKGMFDFLNRKIQSGSIKYLNRRIVYNNIVIQISNYKRYRRKQRKNRIYIKNIQKPKYISRQKQQKIINKKQTLQQIEHNKGNRQNKNQKVVINKLFTISQNKRQIMNSKASYKTETYSQNLRPSLLISKEHKFGKDSLLKNRNSLFYDQMKQKWQQMLNHLGPDQSMN